MLAADSVQDVLGGRSVDDEGVNDGLLRCPRCTSRQVSRCGELIERHGTEAILAVPHKTSNAVEAASAESSPPEESYEWTEHKYDWWWCVGSMDDVDNLGLSRVVESPKGPLKLAMCPHQQVCESVSKKNQQALGQTSARRGSNK